MADDQSQQQQQQPDVFQDPKRALLEHIITLQHEIKEIGQHVVEKRKSLKQTKEALQTYMKKEDVMTTSDVSGIYAQRVKISKAPKMSNDFITDVVTSFSKVKADKAEKFKKKFNNYLAKVKNQAKEETEVLRIKQTAEKLKETRASRPPTKKRGRKRKSGDNEEESDNDSDSLNENDLVSGNEE